jgi:hypothetical protein
LLDRPDILAHPAGYPESAGFAVGFAQVLAVVNARPISLVPDEYLLSVDLGYPAEGIGDLIALRAALGTPHFRAQDGPFFPGLAEQASSGRCAQGGIRTPF